MLLYLQQNFIRSVDLQQQRHPYFLNEKCFEFPEVSSANIPDTCFAFAYLYSKKFMPLII